MASLNKHKDKYDSNKALLNNELNIEKCVNYDWITTVVFYTALHLVEGELAKKEIHPSNHVSRNGSVARFREFAPIRSEYKFLYDRSRVARYGPGTCNKKVAKRCLQLLQDIEKQISF